MATDGAQFADAVERESARETARPSRLSCLWSVLSLKRVCCSWLWL